MGSVDHFAAPSTLNIRVKNVVLGRSHEQMATDLPIGVCRAAGPLFCWACNEINPRLCAGCVLRQESASQLRPPPIATQGLGADLAITP